MKIWSIITTITVLFCLYTAYNNYMIVQKYEGKVTITPADEIDLIELEREFALLDNPEIKFDKTDNTKEKLEKIEDAFDALSDKYTMLASEILDLKEKHKNNETFIDDLTKIGTVVVPLLVPIVTYKYREQLDKPLKKKKKKKE